MRTAVLYFLSLGAGKLFLGFIAGLGGVYFGGKAWMGLIEEEEQNWHQT
jgi:hypothetical protein